MSAGVLEVMIVFVQGGFSLIAITQALELGADCLLFDEDTSTTNFLMRDARMQNLISVSDPITPLVSKVSRSSLF